MCIRVFFFVLTGFGLGARGEGVERQTECILSKGVGMPEIHASAHGPMKIFGVNTLFVEVLTGLFLLRLSVAQCVQGRAFFKHLAQGLTERPKAQS